MGTTEKENKIDEQLFFFDKLNDFCLDLFSVIKLTYIPPKTPQGIDKLTFLSNWV